MKQLFKNYLFGLLSLCSTQIISGPWLSSGEPWTSSANSATKSDVELLASYGFIKAPVLTWPIAWDSIEESLLSDESKNNIKTAPQSVQFAYLRLISQYESATQRQLKGEMFVSGGSNINPFRTFDYQPRSDINSGVEFEKQGEHWAGRMALSYGKYDDLTKSMHVDNSYSYGFFNLGSLGKWGLGIDKMPRWWSPSYVDSLILSNNAPPLPTLTLQRMSAEAFQTKWLKWIGPWSFTTSLSQGDCNGPVTHPLIWLTNFSLRPSSNWQVSLSRVAFFAGDSRSLTWPMLWNLMTLRDNVNDAGVSRKNEPGTQNAEVTVNWLVPYSNKIPTNIYLETTFKDVYFLPSRTNFLIGLNSVFPFWGNSSLRLYAENEYSVMKDYWLFIDTHHHDYYGDPYMIYNRYAYSPYPYYYYNSILASPLSSESKAVNLGAIVSESNGASDEILVRYIRLNTYGFKKIGYPFQKQNVLWLSLNRSVFLSKKLGNLSGQIAYLHALNKGSLSSSPSFYINWSKEL